jgi:hypothetical protein
MKRSHGLLVFFTLVVLMAAGGLTTLSKAPQATPESPVATVAPANLDASPGLACTADAPARTDDPDAVKPGCCSTQCNVDKDCDKICGKGNCACIQENPCCRRCVY